MIGWTVVVVVKQQPGLTELIYDILSASLLCECVSAPLPDRPITEA